MRRSSAILVLIALCGSPRHTAAQSAPQESVAQATGGAASLNWDYGTSEDWPSLDTTYTDCSNGLQSPISINTAQAPMGASAFMRLYYPRGRQNTKLSLTNNGKEIMLGLQERGITLVGEEFKQHYELVSVNYHIPSEHVIDGVRYAVERQMHFAPTDHAAGSASSDTDVVAATSQRNIYSELYDVDTSEGATGDFLIQQLIDAGNLGSGLGDSMARQVNNIRTEFDFLNYPHFYYPGSQTSPPCHEKVNWRISSGIKMVTPQQLQVLADIVHDMYASRSQGSPLPYPTSAYPGTKTTGWDTHQGTARPIMQNNNRSMIMRPFYQHQCVWGNDLQC